MNIQHYTYRVTWSPEDEQHVGLCAEFASLSWLAKTPGAALKGIQKVVSQVVADMQAYDVFYKKLISAVPLKNVTSRFAMEKIKSVTALPVPAA